MAERNNAVRKDEPVAGELDEVIAPEDLERVLRLLREVKFGTVTLVIQDGRVVQIDKLEKIRLK